MHVQTLDLQGQSLIGDSISRAAEEFIQAINPATGEKLEPRFYSASASDVERAAQLAQAAFQRFANTSGHERAKFLRAIADNIAKNTDNLVERAHLETGLPLPRLQGEVGRTTGQLRLFAEVLEEGSWLDARIDLALPDRKPLPRSDIRSMLRPLGPVVVFGASNFPFAFSVAGGDTASALAGGNPVIVKAHPAHPGTSELVGRLMQQTVAESGLPPGVFSLLLDAGIAVGQSIVKHPVVQAVAFTGSTMAGKALMKLCAERPTPIPCYAEMGSTNPLFILPDAMQERAAAIANGLKGSFTLGSGQFCTKPGLVFVPQGDGEPFITTLRGGVDELSRMGMLTPGIAAKYTSAVEERKSKGKAELIADANAGGQSPCASAQPAVFATSLKDFLAEDELEEEIFGPTTLLIHYGSVKELTSVAEKLHGHLTATIHATDKDLEQTSDLLKALESKVGRILFNGYPTGVEVCHAMVHGGPFPATSDSRTTSVGTRAILRFCRPVCYQDTPDALLPPELRQTNPLDIMRMVNGKLTRDAIG
jgi:NADP-dependent aldehyde dehydrogenase